MSNELITPILLHFPGNQDQIRGVETYLQTITQSDKKLQVQWINTELETISIETVRAFIEELSYSTPATTVRVFVLLAAHLLTLPAQQALLKSLEEPPERTLIMVATTQPQALLPTLVSRCIKIVSNTSEEARDLEIPSTLEQLYTDPKSVSFAKCIEIAEGYKDREEALVLVAELLAWSQKHSAAQRVRWGKQLSKTLIALKQNVNVQLALENCFFSLK